MSVWMADHSVFHPCLGLVFCAVRQVSRDGKIATIRSLRDCEYSGSTTFNDLLEVMLSDAYSNQQILAFLDKNTVSVSLHNCTLFSDRSGCILPVSDSSRVVNRYLNTTTSHRFIRFVLTENQSQQPPVIPPTNIRCVNTFLMGHNIIRLLPEKYDENKSLNAAHLTFNKLIDHFSRLKLGFTGDEHSTTSKQRERNGGKRVGHGAKFILCLSELLSYISQHYECTLNEFKISEWVKYCTTEKTSRKSDLLMDHLHVVVSKLRGSIRGSWATEVIWSGIITDIASLCNGLENFITMRKAQAEIMRNNRQSMLPARTPDDAVPVVVKCCGLAGRSSDKRHNIVSDKLRSCLPFEPILVDDAILLYGKDSFISDNAKRIYRLRFIPDDGITLKYACSGLSYVPGGPLPKLIWVWRIDETGVSAAEKILKSCTVVAKIKSEMPIYQSRAALAEVNQLISNLSGEAGPAVKVLVRQLLNIDARQPESSRDKARHDRLLSIVMNSEDSADYVIDLRANNGSQQRFDDWFDLSNQYVSSCELRAHDRRQDDVDRLPTWVSFSHFMTDVQQYHAVSFPGQPYPDEPSESTVLLSFVKSNPYRGSTDFSGRLHVSRTIQKRSVHAEHADTHFCHALRRTLKELSIEISAAFEKNQERDEIYTSLATPKLWHDFVKVESDDKAKVSFGEPSRPIDTGVRAHSKIIAPITADGVSSVAGALDHGFHLGSLTPSVNLFQEIPPRIDQSWVTGDVTVVLNDSTFRPSNGFQHMAQLAMQILNRACSEANAVGYTKFETLRSFYDAPVAVKSKILHYMPSVVILSTDGGGDHKNTTVQNQAAQLSFLLLLDLHVLICNRNAPDGSWVNCVERVMSLLNLGLQHTAYARDKCVTPLIEKAVKQCNSMATLREKAREIPGIINEWTMSIRQVIADIAKRFGVLQLKGRNVIVHSSGDTDDVILLKELLVKECPDYSDNFRTKAELQKHMPSLRDRLLFGGGNQFHYLSEVRGSAARSPEWLKCFFDQAMPLPWKKMKADLHFLPFREVRHLQCTQNVKTDERYMPTSCNAVSKTNTTGHTRDMQLKSKPGMKKIWNQESAISYANCCVCEKPRVIYSLDSKNRRQIITSVSNYLNILPLQCGMPLFAVRINVTTDPYKNAVVKQGTTCGQKIDSHYYMKLKEFAAPDLCVHCGSKESLSLSNDRTEDGQQVRSQCVQCIADGLPRVPFGKRCHQASTQDSGTEKRINSEKTTENSNEVESLCTSNDNSNGSNFAEYRTTAELEHENSTNSAGQIFCCAKDYCFFGENNNLDKVIVYCPICELKSHGKECTTVSDGEIICSSCYQKNL